MENAVRSSGNQPKTRIDNYILYWAIKLAKLGYYGGNPELIKQAPSNIVLNIISYENFENDLQITYRELNK